MEQSVLPIQIAPVVKRGLTRFFKTLYRSNQEGISIQIDCYFNNNTEHIGIYTRFSDGGASRKNPKRTKMLYTSTLEGFRIGVRCEFNKNTEHIGIYTSFGDGRLQARHKTLCSMSYCGVELAVECSFNQHTKHIKIKTSFRKKSGWKGGAVTNPNCGAYLGIVVAEKVLAKVFKNVQQMPNCNPGYDFKCNNGFKIDVKAACSIKDYPHSWMFAIRRNTEADYFLCMAFDNRVDLNPQYIWLIPGKVLNSHVSAHISMSTLDKWAEYELIDKLDDVIACCDVMKSKTIG
jgi:hypothetical protein